MKVLLWGFIAFLAGLLLFYFRLSWLAKWIDRFPGNKKFVYLFKALEDFSTGLLFKLLLLSALRFAVFILQYYLLLCLFNVDISWWNCLWTVSLSFLVLAAIPSFAIADVGLRGEVGLKIIGLLAVNNLGILFTSATIWFINLIIPAIIGSILILGMRKVIRDDSEQIMDKK